MHLPNPDDRAPLVGTYHRKGLIPYRVRIEIKASKRTGEILVVDRQTSVGLDITEQTAAKTALQRAAIELAERLLPKLAK